MIPELGRSPGEDNATQSSILAWRIPWTEETSGLQSMGSRELILGRLIRSPGPSRRKESRALEEEKGIWGSQGGEKDKLSSLCFVSIT